MELIISRISIVAPLIVIPHTIWLMPLMAPFQTYNSNFKQQRKLKAALNPLNLKIHVDMIKYPLNYFKSALLILPHL
jgi:hypothetical protein